MGRRWQTAGLPYNGRVMVARGSMSDPALLSQQRRQHRQRCSPEAGVPAMLLPLLLLCCVGSCHASVGDR